ncbi:peptidase inhibitor 16-like [Harmonia axyridis]|uniref:peptidase inhibitor 16-like n=1 Tax=Harmonia axyridis TaxID=115357 RepID=UPI001E2758B1|nr:peptidase inhibitor 16-like [Harmonia axyridis]
MQLNVFSTILYLIIIHESFSLKKLMKPSFIPYCTTRDKCLPACSCEILPECEVLSMDNSTRESILFYHNQIRDIQSKAEPQPGGITMLKYDLELEEVSKCWAARCEDEYSECFLTSLYPETSMSVTQIQLDSGEAPSNILWIKVINFWLGNTKYLSVETINSLPAGETGENLRNYAQVMSDKVLSVGCAWSKSDVFLTCVCSYGPRGPLQGEPIYKAGTPCSLCPEGYACDYAKPFENLCKQVELPTTSEAELPPTPPTPPAMPPSVKPQIRHDMGISPYYPPPRRYDNLPDVAEPLYERKEKAMKIEYEPQQQPSGVELISEYQPQELEAVPQHLDSRDPFYSIEKIPPRLPVPKFLEDLTPPPSVPPMPQYPTPAILPLVPSVPSVEPNTPAPPPPLLMPELSNTKPPQPPPLPHSPSTEENSFSPILTTIAISPHSLPKLPDPPGVSINTIPPNAPLKQGEGVTGSRLEIPKERKPRSCSNKTMLANMMIIISFFISFSGT